MLNQSSQLNLMFHALADGNRRAMIDRLSRSEVKVSDFTSELGISLPGVMQHLAVLEQAGLVRSEKRGRIRTCTLDTSALSKAEQWINQRRAMWNTQLDSLGRFLAATDSETDRNQD